MQKKYNKQFNKRKKITVGEFYKLYKSILKIKLLNSESGFNKLISEPTVNRPGLAFSGFYTYFANKRIQIIGSAEMSFLNSLSIEQRNSTFRIFCTKKIPCIILSRNMKLESDLLKIAEDHGISVFSSNMITMNFINTATFALETSFAKTSTEHGCMIDVKGIGIFLRGESGIGKSECVLGLLDRGASLIADDLVVFTSVGSNDKITASSKEIGKFHIEVRGLGIINIASIYGIGSVRFNQHLDLVITLVNQDFNKLDRLGAKTEYYKILGKRIRHVFLPVAPGRDMAKVIEVAALDQKLKSVGINSAERFNRYLLKKLNPKNNSLTIA